jgi:hypothetical protein
LTTEEPKSSNSTSITHATTTPTSSRTSSAAEMIKAIESGAKHLIIKRFTLRYPEQKLRFVGDGYQFDPKRGVGIAGSRGRHIYSMTNVQDVSYVQLHAKVLQKQLEW